MYAKVQNQTVLQFPYSIENLKAEHPNKSFASNISTTELATYGVVTVVVTGAPAHDVINQIADQSGCVYNTSLQRWETAWVIRAKTPEELANTIASIQSSIVAATQQRLDDFAKTRNYDSILSACTYASSSVPAFAAEGQRAVDLRDQTWAALYTVMGEVQAQTRPMPASFEDVEPLLPALTWVN